MNRRPSKDNLKDKAVKGIAWNTIGNAARQIIVIITLVIMSRLLSPDDFGIYAILMMLINLLNIFTSMGTPQFIIHSDKVSQKLLSSIFYFNILCGSVFATALILLSDSIAAFFENEDISQPLELISITLVTMSLCYVNKALLEKRIAFKGLVILETVSTFFGSCIGIFLAYNGWETKSLVLMFTSTAIIQVFGLWYISNWRPTLQFSVSDVKSAISYGLNLTAHYSINHFAKQTDQFLIGKYIGSSSLGIYSMAYKIMIYPLLHISDVIVRAVFPVFSELKNNDMTLKNGYLKATKVIALITFPLMLGLMATADNFVVTVFGEKWSDMTKILLILSPIGLIQSIVTTTRSIYMAKGQTRLMLHVGLVNSIIIIIAVLLGLPFGMEGIALSYLISTLILMGPNMYFAVSQLGIQLCEFTTNLFPIFLCAFLMALSVYIMGAHFNISEEPHVELMTQVLSGVVLYAVLLFIFSNSFITEVMGTISTALIKRR